MCVTYSLVFSVTCLLVTVQGDVQQHTDQAGIRCGNFTGVEGSKEAEAEHYHCVECLYPQNCLVENHCRLGTSGDTCEKCLNDFHRVGSTCVKCPSFPWPAVSFGVYFLILVASIFYHGLTDSVCTKVKLLSHFLQNVLLTLHIKIDWPEQLLEIFGIVNFGKFNSEILNPECLFSSWPALSAHYLEWLTSLCIPVLTILLGKFLDASMKKLLRIKDSDLSENTVGGRQNAWQKRTTVRRLVFMVVVITYMPSTLSCIRTYLCSDTIPKLLVFDHTTNVFLLDNTVSCDTFVFQTIHFSATVYLVFVGLFLPPLLILFTLRQKKWNLLYSQWFLYGPVYEPYKEKFCFWEAFPLLRKLIGIIITEAYPVSAFIQTVTQLGMTGLYLLAVTALRPYRSCYWVHQNFNVHLFFEVISNLAVCLLQTVGLSIVIQQYQSSSDLVAASCICVVVIVWVVLVLAMICENTPKIDLPQVISNLAVCLLQTVGLSIVIQQYQSSSDLVAASCICVVVIVWVVLVLAMICENTPKIDLPQVISNLAVCLLQTVGLSIVIQQYQSSSDLVAASCICVVVIVWVVLVLAMICENTPKIDLPQVISNLAVCLLQTVGLSIVIQQYQSSSDLVAASCICVVVIVWVVLVLAMICENTPKIDLPQVDVPVASSSRQSQPHRNRKYWCMLCAKTKVEPDQKFVEKIKENKVKLDF